MQNQWAYRIILGTMGAIALLFGFALTASFFIYQRPFSDPGIPTGPVGYYFVAFAGCALMGWGGGLIGAARAPETSRTVTTVTAWVLCFMAVVRMTAWFVGDYSMWLGELPRLEAGVLLVVALLLVWLRPESGAHAPGRAHRPESQDTGSSAGPAGSATPEGSG